MVVFNELEQDIIFNTLIREEKPTLETLKEKLKISISQTEGLLKTVYKEISSSIDSSDKDIVEKEIHEILGHGSFFEEETAN